MPRSGPNGHKTHNLFPLETFTGFGPSQFYPDGLSTGSHAIQSRSSKRLRREVRDVAPKQPGVYGMLDARGRVIYIGKAKNLRSRLLSYFRPNSRAHKAGKILEYTRTLLWEFAPDELAALLRELELIRRFRPRYNVLGQPGRQRYRYVCLGRAPVATAFVTREPTGKELACYGPFVGRDQLDRAVRRINDWFQLRDCAQTQSMIFAEERRLFDEERAPACLRHELGMCLGPCAALTTRKEYRQAVTQARAFLDGHSSAMVETLQQQMATAAAAMQYERASAVRDKLQDVQWLQQRLSTLRTARNQTAIVYRLAGHDGRIVWYLMNRGQIWAAVHEPTTPEARQRTAELLEAVSHKVPHVGHLNVDSVLLVSAWFRKRPEEHARLVPARQVKAELASGENSETRPG